MNVRQIVLDTETTGLEVQRGHRIVEIGCVELIQRRRTGNEFHRYINPDREIDEGARAVTGISDEFLRDKPRFAQIAEEFLAFVDGAEIVAHNAAFDVGFIEAELARAQTPPPRFAERVAVLDTLALAREKYPGQRNSLDALCKRLGVDDSHRDQHGALLDAHLLAEVYLALTAGQGHLGFGDESASLGARISAPVSQRMHARPRVVRAADAELALHGARMDAIDKASRGACLWKHLEAGEDPA